jgi:arginyl-tRNA synthetase
MAEIVLGIGTSHSPILSMEPVAWVVRAQTDGSVRKLIDNAGRMVSYDELLAAADPKLEGEIAEDKLQARHAANQRGIAAIREALYAAKPDVLIMFGDDHMEV